MPDTDSRLTYILIDLINTVIKCPKLKFIAFVCTCKLYNVRSIVKYMTHTAIYRANYNIIRFENNTVVSCFHRLYDNKYIVLCRNNLCLNFMSH